ncbi:type II secretion system F family protein [Actinomyces oricola]|uniref:type II secretion system F family protein n=1 Tax=Actinomyces oricola TaxID=206043 RepID=UPI000FFF436A|nr:type II secretion system F family protein [Actinomyces oricola]
MGAIVGLLAGTGLLLICMAATSEPPQWRSERARRLSDLLVQAGAGRTSPALFLAGSAALGLVVALVFLGVSQAWSIALAFGAIGAWAPWMLISSRARARRTRLREIWPEAIDTLVSAVRAGMSLPEALASLGQRGPEAVRAEFTAFAIDYASTARFDACLNRLKDRFADPVADRIVEALRLAHETGGTNLSLLLQALSRMLREDMRTRGELEARQSWTVNGAKVAVAAPWLILALLATRAEAATAYATTAGALVLAGGGVASIVAYRLMLRLGRLPEDERILR